MFKKQIQLVLPFIFVIPCAVVFTVCFSDITSSISESRTMQNRTCVVIDAGHGGEDGGATSCTGILESELNLEISIRLNDLFHLLGYQTVMVRSTNQAVNTKGETISQRKISDLKERVRVVNSTKNSLLISIHQNNFSDPRYSGAQMFYSKTSGSKELANILQTNVNSILDTNNNRKEKLCTDVYLMEHVDSTAVLIECGFLSNAEEEAKLRSNQYQKKLCITIASSVADYLDRENLY